MDEKNPRPAQEREPELNRPEEAVKDLEPDEKASEEVKGGVSLNYSKITVQY